MNISEILEALEKLQSEHAKITVKYKDLDLYDREIPAFAEYWYEHVADFFLPFVGFEETIPLYEVLDKDNYEEYVLDEDSEEHQEVIEEFRRAVPSPITIQEFIEDLRASSKIEIEIEKISSENQLHRLNFDKDVFLGFDSLYYESSRCW